MKRSVLLGGFFILALLSLSFISSANETDTRGFECLSESLNNCSLTLEETTFTYLASKECKTELMDYSLNDGECWPESNCNLKATSQAILALENSNSRES